MRLVADNAGNCTEGEDNEMAPHASNVLLSGATGRLHGMSLGCIWTSMCHRHEHKGRQQPLSCRRKWERKPQGLLPNRVGTHANANAR